MFSSKPFHVAVMSKADAASEVLRKFGVTLHRTTTIVDATGKVRCGQWTFPVQRPHGAMVWIARHVDDSFTALAKASFNETYPSILWTKNKALCKYECGGYVE